MFWDILHNKQTDGQNSGHIELREEEEEEEEEEERRREREKKKKLEKKSETFSKSHFLIVLIKKATFWELTTVDNG